MVVQDIIPDKILLVEFQPIGPRRLRPEYKTLPLGIKTPGTIHDPRPGSQFPQIHPAGPPEGYLHQLPHRGPDYPGIDNPRFGNFHRGNTGRGRRNRGKGGRPPDRRGLIFFRRADEGRGRACRRGNRGSRRRRAHRRGNGGNRACRRRRGRFRERSRRGFGGNRIGRRENGLFAALRFSALRFRPGIRKNRGQGFGKGRQGRLPGSRRLPDRFGKIKNRLLQTFRPGTLRRIFRGQDYARLIRQFLFLRNFPGKILKDAVFKTFGGNFRDNFRPAPLALPDLGRLSARRSRSFGGAGKGSAGQKD
jgi:hypothetical protein